MADLIRDHDWSDGLGPVEVWPSSLRSALSICLSSTFPTAIYWGPELRLLYNDSWAPIPGERHPDALGRPASEVWADIWDVVGPQLDEVMTTGKGISTYDQMLPMVRAGVQTETYWNYSFTAIRDEYGAIVGIFNQGNETTAAVLARRQAQQEISRLGRMFAQTPAAIAILEGPTHVFTLVNAAYELLVQRSGLVGKTVAEALPEVQDQGFIDLLDTVYTSAEPYIGRAVPIDFILAGGQVEQKHVDFVFQPMINAEGETLGIFVQATDVSEVATAMAALRESEERFEAIVNSIDQMIWSTTPDGHHDYFNQRWYQYTGLNEGETNGLAWDNPFHPDDRAHAWQVWQHSLATGEPYHVEYRLRHHSGEYRWVIGRAQCVRDEEARIIRWYGTCTDIHDLKLAEEARQLLLRELNHRVKNLFSITSGMINMTARTAVTVPAMAETLQGRLRALAKAHELVQPAISAGPQAPETGSLRSLIEDILSPHVEDCSRVSLSGPPVEIGLKASTSLALIFHELATNAAKYGAFAGAEGKLNVRWAIIDQNLYLDWSEALIGRQISAPSSLGFGSKLARTSATQQLGGEIAFNWAPDGLQINMRVAENRLDR
ncbi:PAS domain S-box protein [Rhizobium glycinendophyticum]|uniref:Blue-light-activated histidine kinase n=1 Tax=Rhizobium glycinendophyticum TaxID=2589807 RepID=A0A504UK86_9HYPH|nr:PAS domain S-box protein [Rhizobium glycinendophyticum]